MNELEPEMDPSMMTKCPLMNECAIAGSSVIVNPYHAEFKYTHWILTPFLNSDPISLQDSNFQQVFTGRVEYSVDPDQLAQRSQLIWIYTILPGYIWV